MGNIPTITRNLLIINVIIYLVQVVADMQFGYGQGYIDPVTAYGGLYFFLTERFILWQPFTYMFLHGGWTHLFFNMFALWMFGSTIERTFGPKRYLIYYLVCGIGAGVCQEIAQFLSFLIAGTVHLGPTVGASGAIYGILLAFGMSYPNERLYIFPIPFPLKAKWFVSLYVVIELFMAIGAPGDGVAHTAHLGGMIVGFLLITYWRKKAGYGYQRSTGGGFIDKVKLAIERFLGNIKRKPEPRKQSEPQPRNDDREYNRQKKARQDEIDALLDKIRKGGYDALTKEEKQRLFELSHND